MLNPIPVTSRPCLTIVERGLSSAGRDLGCWEVKEECHGVSRYPGKWLVRESGVHNGNSQTGTGRGWHNEVISFRRGLMEDKGKAGG